MSNFAVALQAHLESLPTLNHWEKRALTVCQGPDSPRKQRLMQRWERKSAGALDLDWQSVIDWFKAVDWVKVLQVVVAILALLMMFAEPAPADEPTMTGWFPGENIIKQFIPEILDCFVMPPLAAMIADAQERMEGLPVALGYDATAARAYILAKIEESV